MRNRAPDFNSFTRVCRIWYVRLKIFKTRQNGLEMALEANRKDTTQTRGLVIFISNIFSTYFVYSQKFSYNILA